MGGKSPSWGEECAWNVLQKDILAYWRALGALLAETVFGEKEEKWLWYFCLLRYRFDHVLSTVDNFYYYWNPCHSFSVGTPGAGDELDECKDVAVS